MSREGFAANQRSEAGRGVGLSEEGDDVTASSPTSPAIIGIDPGQTGAVALLIGSSLSILDIPTHRLGGRLRIDVSGLANIFDGWSNHAPIVFLEKVGTRPGEGAVGAFSFGHTVGLLRGMAAAHFMPVHEVTPSAWKAAMRCPADKDGARARASTLMPRHAQNWPLKKHDGRAEAALIALYGATQITGVGSG